MATQISHTVDTDDDGVSFRSRSVDGRWRRLVRKAERHENARRKALVRCHQLHAECDELIGATWELLNEAGAILGRRI